jgi:hypothetical protein
MATSNKLGTIPGTPAGPTRQHYRLATGEDVLQGQASTASNSDKKNGGLSTMKSSKGKSK